MSLAQLNLGPFTPLVPLFLVIGAFTIWLWGRHTSANSGRPVAVLAATLSSILAIILFVWQQSVAAPQVLGGPTWMTVPGRALASIDLSFQIDQLSLFWLVLVSGLGAMTIALDSVSCDRGRLMWPLLALAGAQLILLTNNLVILFACWEITQIALWRLTVREHKDRDIGSPRMLFMALATDLPLLTAVVICWQNFGSFHISLLTDPELLAAISSGQQAAIVLLGFCVIGAAYARCLQFPFCSPVLHAADAAADTLKLTLCTVILPTGLYLLFRFQSWTIAGSGSLALLTGVGCLSGLLWGGMAVTQPTRVRSVVAFLGGTVGLIFVGIGCAGGENASLLLLSGSTISGGWAILQLIDDESDRRRTPFAARSAAVIAVVLTCGVFGQEAVLNASWSAMHSASEVATPTTDDPALSESTEITAESPVIGPVIPVVIMLAHLLLSVALFRGLFRRSSISPNRQHDEPHSRSGTEDPSDSVASRPPTLILILVLVIGLAAAPLLATSSLWNGSALPLTAPGVTGILMLLAMLLAVVLYGGSLDWPARIEHASGALASLSRRSFYADELIQLIWVMPCRFLGWLAATGDRSFMERLNARLFDLEAGTRKGLQASFAEGPLTFCVLTLIMGAAVTIVLLIQG